MRRGLSVKELLADPVVPAGKVAVLNKGFVKKLVVQSGCWEDRRWNDRWMELRSYGESAELIYSMQEGEKPINRIPTHRIAEVSAIKQTLISKAAYSSFLSRNGLSEQTISDMISCNMNDLDDLRYTFLVRTQADGSSRGREYLFKTTSESEVDAWTEMISKTVESYEKPVLPLKNRIRPFLRRFYRSSEFQLGVGIMIGTNFITDIIQAQLNPFLGTDAQMSLEMINTVLSVMFGIELVIHFVSSEKFIEFFQDGWNWLDSLVVITSLIAIAHANVPGLNQLRMIRIFRNFRLLKSIKSLNKIITALQVALPAVGNAFILAILIWSAYSVLGVIFFKSHSEGSYGTFSMAMFTLWQYITFDNACDVTIGLMNDQSSSAAKLGTAVFGISFQLVIAYALMSIVMAALLDEFGATCERSRLEELTSREREVWERSQKSLDPLLAQLRELESSEIEQEVEDLFKFIDEDGSGSVDYTEMKNGFLRMDFVPPIRFRQEDFDHLVIKRGLHDENRRMSAENFKTLLRKMVQEYEVARINRAVEENRLEEKLNAALQSLKEVVSSTRKIKVLEAQIQSLNNRFTRIEASVRRSPGGESSGGRPDSVQGPDDYVDWDADPEELLSNNATNRSRTASRDKPLFSVDKVRLADTGSSATTVRFSPDLDRSAGIQRIVDSPSQPSPGEHAQHSGPTEIRIS